MDLKQEIYRQLILNNLLLFIIQHSNNCLMIGAYTKNIKKMDLKNICLIFIDLTFIMLI